MALASFRTQPGAAVPHFCGGLLCELTARAASGPHYRRGEWPVSTSSGPRRRVWCFRRSVSRPRMGSGRGVLVQDGAGVCARLQRRSAVVCALGWLCSERRMREGIPASPGARGDSRTSRRYVRTAGTLRLRSGQAGLGRYVRRRGAGRYGFSRACVGLRLTAY